MVVSTPVGGCTGTLVARNVVLTAGHCVKKLSLTDLKKIRVFGGLLDFKLKPNPSDDFIVARVQESRDYESGIDKTAPNDLAYLELGRNSTVAPTAITYGRPKAGTDQRIRGYGKVADTEAGKNSILHEALVRIVNKRLRRTRSRFSCASGVTRCRSNT